MMGKRQASEGRGPGAIRFFCNIASGDGRCSARGLQKLGGLCGAGRVLGSVQLEWDPGFCGLWRLF